MFSGRYEHTIDAKGRVSLPVKFREVLGSRDGDTVVLAPRVGFTCLEIQPLHAWKAFLEKLQVLPQFEKNVMTLKRVYVSGAIECPIDRLGRILVPQSLRSYAKLGRDVLWAGAAERAELWSIELWQKQIEHDNENGPAILGELGKLGI